MSNRNRNANPTANDNSTEENTMTNKPETTAKGKPAKGGAKDEKLTSFNATCAILRKTDAGYKFVLSFRPTVRGTELWASMAGAIKTHIANPRTIDRNDDHILVEDEGETDVVTHWAIIRSDRRCPVCGNPTATPADWCVSEFCENARNSEPTEKKSRRVENPDAIDF